jgi:hypothetical protein
MPTLLGLFGLFGLSFKIMLGVAAGLAVAAFHLWADRRASDGATTDPPPLQLRLGMLRVGVPVIAFLVLWKFSLWTLIGAALAFKYGRGLIMPQLQQGQRSSES